MLGKPWHSLLVPYEAEIIALRRKKPPIPYSQIAALLNEKYQITIRRETIYRFMQVRAKQSSKTCKHAWDIVLPEEPKQPEAPSVQKAAVPKPSVQEKPKQEEKKENVTVSKPFVQEKPKQEEKDEIDIEGNLRKPHERFFTSIIL